MSNEVIAILAVGIPILAVGVAMLGFLWKLHLDLVDVKKRLARVEATVDLLVRGLHIEISGRGQTP